MREDGKTHLVYGFPKETFTAIIMLNKISIVKVHSPDGDTDFFVACFMPGDKLAQYLFIICLDYVLRKLTDLKQENSFTIFTNPSSRAGYDTREIFQRSLTGLNSEFSFS